MSDNLDPSAIQAALAAAIRSAISGDPLSGQMGAGPVVTPVEVDGGVVFPTFESGAVDFPTTLGFEVALSQIPEPVEPNRAVLDALLIQICKGGDISGIENLKTLLADYLSLRPILARHTLPGSDAVTDFADNSRFESRIRYGRALINSAGPVIRDTPMRPPKSGRGNDQLVSDRDWAMINTSDYRTNVKRTATPTVNFEVALKAPVHLAKGRLECVSQTAKKLPEFVQEMINYFFVAVTEGTLSRIDMYDVAKLLAYHKLKDEKALNDAIKSDPPSNYVHQIENVCTWELETFRALGYLTPRKSLPRPICARGGKPLNRDDDDTTDERKLDLAIRLVPYANILLLRYATPENSAPPWLPDILHEVAHYLFWNGTAQSYVYQADLEPTDRCSFEVWTIKALRKLKLTHKLLPEFEEYFCDLVQMALGGPLAMISILRSLKETEPDNIARRSLTLGMFDVLYPDWGPIVFDWWYNESRQETTKLTDPLAILVGEKEIIDLLSYLRRYVPAEAALIKWLQDWEKGSTEAQKRQAFLDATDNMVAAMESWMGSLSAAGAESETEMFFTKHPADVLDFPTLIEGWELKNETPDYFGGDRWVAVIQANGWSTQGPRTDITE